MSQDHLKPCMLGSLMILQSGRNILQNPCVNLSSSFVKQFEQFPTLEKGYIQFFIRHHFVKSPREARSQFWVTNLHLSICLYIWRLQPNSWPIFMIVWMFLSSSLNNVCIRVFHFSLVSPKQILNCSRTVSVSVLCKHSIYFLTSTIFWTWAQKPVCYFNEWGLIITELLT